MKHLTRRQVSAWLHPIRKAFAEVRSDNVDSIRGYPVTRLDADDTYARVDECIAGFVGCLARIFPEVDLSALTRLQKKLAAGTPIAVPEIDAGYTCLKTLETPLIRAPWESIKDAIVKEQVAIELDRLGLVR